MLASASGQFFATARDWPRVKLFDQTLPWLDRRVMLLVGGARTLWI
jgi:hypothetical protein